MSDGHPMKYAQAHTLLTQYRDRPLELPLASELTIAHFPPPRAWPPPVRYIKKQSEFQYPILGPKLRTNS